MNTSRLQILLVEHRDADAMLLHRMLQHAPTNGFEVCVCKTAEAAIDRLGDHQYDGLIINLDHEDQDPFEVLLRIRNLDPRLAILGITDRSDESFGLRMVECGAQDVIAKEMLNGQLLYRAMRYGIARQRQISCLKTAAHTDALTGLGNRRALDQALDQAVADFAVDRQPFGFLILDVDNFKQFNDQHGHRAGDYVLSQLGSLLRTAVTGNDLCSRYGGEEFGILIPATSTAKAVAKMKDLLQRIAEHFVEFEGTQYRVTSSAGLTISRPNDTVGSIIERADIALYRAKSDGRNRGDLNLPSSAAVPLSCETIAGGNQK